VRSIDPLLPLTQVQTVEQVVSESEASRRFNTALISSFAFAAVLLAVLGIYSVIAFSVASRVQEMAIRVTLGSQRSAILRLVLESGAKLAAIGCVIGLTGAAAASGLLRSMLFGVSPFDPLVLLLAAVCVLLLAVGASVPPALRAASIDPIARLLVNLGIFVALGSGTQSHQVLVFAGRAVASTSGTSHSVDRCVTFGSVCD
jgi:ABC-type antimicrobial peptide transport system permease subunit